MAAALDTKGFKRICMSCGTRFYDLNKTPIVCPNCSTEFTGEIKVKARRGRLAANDMTKDSQISDALDSEEEDDVPVLSDDDVEEDDEAVVSLEDVEEDADIEEDDDMVLEDDDIVLEEVDDDEDEIEDDLEDEEEDED